MRSLVCLIVILVLTFFPSTVKATLIVDATSPSFTVPNIGGIGNFKISPHQNYLIFDQEAKKAIGVIFGGTEVAVEKIEDDWLYFAAFLDQVQLFDKTIVEKFKRNNSVVKGKIYLGGGKKAVIAKEVYVGGGFHEDRL